MQKKLTITVSEEVYDGLYAKVGARKISQFIERLARNHLLSDKLHEGYAALAADQEQEQEANTWIEGLVGDTVDETR